MSLRIGVGFRFGQVGVGLPPPAVTLDAPLSTGRTSLLLAGVLVTVSGTCEAGCTVEVLWNGVSLGAAVVVGTDWTYAWTPSAGQEGAFDLTAVATRTSNGAANTSTAETPRVLADAVLRTAVLDPTSFTRTGTALDTLVNTVSGVSYATKVGAPGWTADDAGSGLPGFTWNGASGLRLAAASDPAVAALLNGVEKAFCAIFVQRTAVADANGVWFGSGLSSHALNSQTMFGQRDAGAGLFTFIRVTTTGRIWDSEAAATGRLMVTMRSADGLTVLTRKNEGAESTETLTSAGGSVASDRLGFGIIPALTDGAFFTGTTFEYLLIAAHKDATTLTDVRARLNQTYSCF